MKSTVKFTDVTDISGIDHQQHTLVDPMIDYSVAGAMSGGASAADYDSDGFIDLYVTRLDAPDILYRNNGDGTFEDVTAMSGINRIDGSNGSGWADIDNDGDLDLYTTSISDSQFYLYINDGEGNFTEEAISRGAAIEGSDLHNGFSVSFGDYDNDGYLDIHTTEWRLDAENPTGALSNSRLLRNMGDVSPGHFEDVTQSANVNLDEVTGISLDGTFSFTSRFSDLDGDGYLDLAIAGDFGESRLFWNNGDGTFTDGTASSGVGTDENGMGSVVADFNGDGLLDWFVTAIYGDPNNFNTQEIDFGLSGNRLYLNNGDRTFTDATDSAGVRDGGWGWGTTSIDYDNDGDLDLVMTNGVKFGDLPVDDPYENDQMKFWENDGNGKFTEVGESVGITDSGTGKGLLKFDHDNDGDLDLFVVNTGDSPVLYRNDGGNANDWLRIKSFGTKPSIGASISVTEKLGESTQLSEINGSSNFLGQDEATVHFGLGEGDDVVHQVQIKWLDGRILELNNVARNTTLSIAHGESDAYEGTTNKDYIIGSNSSEKLSGNSGNDTLDGGMGNDTLIGGSGDDTLLANGDDHILGGNGDDSLFVTIGGNNFLTGGSGVDNFLVVNEQLPTSANTITDFEINVDKISIVGLGITSVSDLEFNQIGDDTVITFSEADLLLLQNTQAIDLEANQNFIFG